MIYQSFLSPQVKRCPIISHKRARYEFPHEVPNMPIVANLAANKDI